MKFEISYQIILGAILGLITGFYFITGHEFRIPYLFSFDGTAGCICFGGPIIFSIVMAFLMLMLVLMICKTIEEFRK